jgi:hypothetical protein
MGMNTTGTAPLLPGVCTLTAARSPGLSGLDAKPAPLPSPPPVPVRGRRSRADAAALPKGSALIAGVSCDVVDEKGENAASGDGMVVSTG